MGFINRCIGPVFSLFVEDYPVCGIVFGCVLRVFSDARIARLGGGCRIVRMQWEYGCRNAIFNCKRTDGPTTACSGIDRSRPARGGTARLPAPASPRRVRVPVPVHTRKYAYARVC